jgi:hypothetical protein
VGRCPRSNDFSFAVLPTKILLLSSVVDRLRHLEWRLFGGDNGDSTNADVLLDDLSLSEMP